MDPQLALVVALVTTVVGCGGLYLRMSAREAAHAKWRGGIETDVENLKNDAKSVPAQLRELEAKMTTQHDALREEIARRDEKLHSRISDVKAEVHGISLSMARSGINGGHRKG